MPASKKKTAASKGKKRAASPVAEPTPASAPASPVAAKETAATTGSRAKRAKTEVAAKEDATVTPAPSKRPVRAAAAAAAAASVPAPSASSSSAASSGPSATSLSTLHSFAKGEVGEVFAIGSGDCSQLGLGPDEELREVKYPTLLTHLTKKHISTLAIAAGSLHNLIIDKNHAVWSWGCNDDSALGRESDEWLPEPVDGPLGKGSKSHGVPVVQIACGASHSLALAADGDVYCFGTFRDANGVIGFSETIEAAKVPMKMSFGTVANKHKIVMIAAGEHHDLALTDNGEGRKEKNTNQHKT